MHHPSLSLLSIWFWAAILLGLSPSESAAQSIDILSVDITPLVSPGGSRFGPQNTIGMALQKADPGGLFQVTEVTPLAFQAMSAQELSTFDLIAVNNQPDRISPGLGTTWHDVVGVERGGRVVLNSHDAVRFHFNAPPGSLGGVDGFPMPGPGVEPFGADDLVREAALWAGGIPGMTGLLIFNDAPFFNTCWDGSGFPAWSTSVDGCAQPDTGVDISSSGVHNHPLRKFFIVITLNISS